MRINTNVASLVAQENAANTQFKLSSSLEKLSSGLKINKAADDASGLAIADKLRTQGTSIDQGIANGNSAVTLLQIADKSMSEQSNILDTIKAKLIQANTDTTSDDGRESIRKDISKLLEQLDNIAEQTNYNGYVLLQAGAGEEVADRAASADLNFQIGESKNDIISNTSVQSNTNGLGSNVSHTAQGVTSIGNAATITVAGSDAIKLTSNTISGDNAVESATLSGDVDNFVLSEGMVLTGLDSASKTLLAAQMTAGTDYTIAGSEFTITAAGAGKTLDLSTNNNVSMTVTTAGETPSGYAPVQGDVVTIGNTNEGSDLETALGNALHYTNNGDGTYTAKAAVPAASINLQPGEEISVSSTTIQHAFSTGDTVLTSSLAGVAAGDGSALGDALADAGKFKLETNGNYTSLGANTFTVTSTQSFDMQQAETVSVTEGDIITATAANLNAGSDLSNELTDISKFDSIGNDMYKAKVDIASISLQMGENITLADASVVAVAGTITPNSTITLTSDAITGSDLYNNLTNTGKFTLDSGTDGLSGAVYSVRVDVTTASIKLAGDESISIKGSVDADFASGNLTTFDISNITFGANAQGTGTVGQYSTGQEGFQETGENTGTDPLLTASSLVNVAFDIAATGVGTFDVLDGDTITINNEASGSELRDQIEGTGASGFIDNGDGTYTATANVTISFADVADEINVIRGYEAAGGTTTATGAGNTTIDRDTTNLTIAPTSSSTSVTGVTPTSIDFTTDTKVDVTNNATGTDTLSMSSTSEITNGGLQLKDLAAITENGLTKELADSFQAVVDDAITVLNGYRGDVGSTQNQVESAVRNLMTQSTNVKAAESIIRDVDYAQESANFNKQNIISQAGTYAMSQANSAAQNVLRLLQ